MKFNKVVRALCNLFQPKINPWSLRFGDRLQVLHNRQLTEVVFIDLAPNGSCAYQLLDGEYRGARWTCDWDDVKKVTARVKSFSMNEISN